MTRVTTAGRRPPCRAAWGVIVLIAAALLLAGCGPDAEQGRKGGQYTNTAGKKGDEGGPLKQ